MWTQVGWRGGEMHMKGRGLEPLLRCKPASTKPEHREQRGHGVLRVGAHAAAA